MAGFQRHVFVCINQRDPSDPRGCCGAKGGEAVAAELKKAVHERGLKRVVRSNKAGCLDQCAHGVTVVVYPEGVWYGGVTVADVAEIVDEHVINGRPVRRLMIPPRRLTGLDAPGKLKPLVTDPDPGAEDHA